MGEKIRFEDIEHIIREMLDMGKSFKISPNGCSMMPLIRQGADSVYIKKPTGRLKKYDIAFFKRDDGSFILHRVIRVRKNSYVFCGDAQLYPESGITDRHIIGVVTEIERDGKVFSVDEPEYIKYSKDVVKSRWKKNYKILLINNTKGFLKKTIFFWYKRKK